MSRRGGGGRKQNVSYVKPEEPAFLKRLKEQVGYKEGPNIDSKRPEAPTFEDDEEGDRIERESEKPQVVVLREGDIDQEELDRIMKDKAEEEERKKIDEGKITFKKPIKRQSSNNTADDNDEGSTISTTKKTRPNESSDMEKTRSNAKATSESRLLSFGSPDEEDDDD